MTRFTPCEGGHIAISCEYTIHIAYFTKEALYLYQLSEAFKGARNLLDPPACGALFYVPVKRSLCFPL